MTHRSASYLTKSHGNVGVVACSQVGFGLTISYRETPTSLHGYSLWGRYCCQCVWDAWSRMLVSAGERKQSFPSMFIELCKTKKHCYHTCIPSRLPVLPSWLPDQPQPLQQLLPQIVLNFRRRSTTGLKPSFMLLWASAGCPLAVYNIVHKFNIALIVQPQILTGLSLITWSQCCVYGEVSLRRQPCKFVVGMCSWAKKSQAKMDHWSTPPHSHPNRPCLRFSTNSTYPILSYWAIPPRSVANNAVWRTRWCPAVCRCRLRVLWDLENWWGGRHLVPILWDWCSGWSVQRAKCL